MIKNVQDKMSQSILFYIFHAFLAFTGFQYSEPHPQRGCSSVISSGGMNGKGNP